MVEVEAAGRGNSLSAKANDGCRSLPQNLLTERWIMKESIAAPANGEYGPKNRWPRVWEPFTLPPTMNLQRRGNSRGCIITRMNKGFRTEGGSISPSHIILSNRSINNPIKIKTESKPRLSFPFRLEKERTTSWIIQPRQWIWPMVDPKQCFHHHESMYCHHARLTISATNLWFQGAKPTWTWRINWRNCDAESSC